MGCDKALHIETDAKTDFGNSVQTLNIAKVFTQLCSNDEYKQYKPDLLLFGKQSIDTDCNHTGQMVAAKLNWPIATYVSSVKIDKPATSSSVVNVTREIDGGLQELKLKLPAVVTSDLRLNTPRYATLPNIMKAKKKPIDTIPFSKILPDNQLNQNVQTIKVEEPAAKSVGIILQSVEELLVKLKNEAKVL